MRKRLVLLSFVAAVSLVSAAPAQPGKKAAAPKEEGKPEAGKAAKAEPEKADRPVAAGEAAPVRTGHRLAKSGHRGRRSICAMHNGSPASTR